MRQIGEIENREQAGLFVAYLATKGISAKAEAEKDVWEVWVNDEDKLDDATSELDAFLAAPDAKQYAGSIQRAGELKREEEIRHKKIQQNIVKISEAKFSRKKGALTTLLIVISAIVALFTNVGDEANWTEFTFRTLVFVGLEEPAASEAIQQADGNPDAFSLRMASISRLEVWRLITPIFIHLSMVHLIFNMIWIFQLGRVIETRYGTFWFGILVLAVAIISNVAQSVAPGQMGGSVPGMIGDVLLSPSGGMSGVVYGLFGFIWMKSTYDRASGLRIPQSTVIILLVWLFFCMTPLSHQLLGISVGNWAHGVGLIVGMVGGLLPTIKLGKTS